MKLVTMLAVVVVMLAMAGGEVATDAMQVGHAMQENDARLAAAHGIGE